jgi:hypothetical protein
MGSRPALVLASLVAVIAAGSTASDAEAITRGKANAVALKRLNIDRENESVIVFGLPRPLRRGTAVHEALPPRGNARRGRVPVFKLKRRAWLYWADQAPRASFTHASRLLLVAKRGGQVILDRSLFWWPLVNKRRPAFLRSATGYEKPRYRVLAANATSAASAPQPRGSPEPIARIAQTLDNDCAITVGDISDPKFAGSIRMVQETLRGQGAHRVVYAGTKESLVDSIETLQRAGCGHIAIFLIGHAAGPYVRTALGPRGTLEPTIQLGLKAVRIGPDRAKIEADRLTATELRKILNDARGRNAGNSFSVVVEGCWGGRFVPPLAVLPNVALAASAVGARELAMQYLPPGSQPVLEQPDDPSHIFRPFLSGYRENNVPNDYGASGFINALMKDLPKALADGRGLAAALGKAIFHPSTENTTYTFGSGHTQLAVEGKLVLSGTGDTRVDLTGDGRGNVRGDGHSQDIPVTNAPANSFQVRTGTELTLTATPAEGYEWGGWGGSCNTGEPDEPPTCTFVARRPTEVVYATFAKQ